MDSQWFVLQTLSGQEQKVERSLNQRIAADEMGEFIDEVLVPMEKVVEVKGGKKSASSRKLFPGYVFIRMKLFDDEKRIIEKPWYFIRNTQGIIGFLGGERPVSTPAADIDDIKAQVADSEETEKPKVNFEMGEEVKINDGPFQSYTGAVEAIDAESGKLKVNIDIFGRSTPVELEYWQVEKQ